MASTQDGMLDRLTVADVMLRRPKTLPAGATVAQARAAFLDDHVHLLLLVDGQDRLTGTLQRDDIPDSAAGTERTIGYLSTAADRTVGPALCAEDARQLLLAAGQRRRAVVDPGGRLIGLLALKRRLTGFCSAADVASRAAEREGLLASGR
ncbi:CBS domain-containing protein [Kineosporia sp. J2-2]|uniref:CBS domain-containing protein n=1 Tax=Kineosporia corallincola TaxID=2835133 RepID=A0ABS5TKR9_9ACTN|nr:CBS domain-containing protein [Kineosporia corallincola]MBT0771610.1 CBS domain-containing protein [Kineosporia corallincola]